MNREFYRRFIMLCLFYPFLFVARLFFELWFFPTTTFLENYVGGTRFDETDRSAHSRSADSVIKLDNCPFSKSGWATAATTAATEEFSQSIQAPSSTHPGISYPVRANHSLRFLTHYSDNSNFAGQQLSSAAALSCFPNFSACARSFSWPICPSFR